MHHEACRFHGLTALVAQRLIDHDFGAQRLVLVRYIRDRFSRAIRNGLAQLILSRALARINYWGHDNLFEQQGGWSGFRQRDFRGVNIGTKKKVAPSPAIARSPEKMNTKTALTAYMVIDIRAHMTRLNK
jgi:hypothetical protein